MFLTEDTAPGIAALPLSMHLYLYAWANPVNRIDPSGLQQPPPTCDFGDICATGPTGPYVGSLPWTPPPPPFTYSSHYRQKIEEVATRHGFPPIIMAASVNLQSPGARADPIVWMPYGTVIEVGESYFPYLSDFLSGIQIPVGHIVLNLGGFEYHSYGICQIRLFEARAVLKREVSPFELAYNDYTSLEILGGKIAGANEYYLSRCSNPLICQNDNQRYAVLAVAQNGFGEDSIQGVINLGLKGYLSQPGHENDAGHIANMTGEMKKIHETEGWDMPTSSFYDYISSIFGWTH